MSFPHQPRLLPCLRWIQYLALGTLASPFALAEEAEDGAALEEVVVTASYRNTLLAEVSGSAAVLRDEQLVQYGQSHLGELLNQIANVNFAAGASRPRFYQIRGIGERSQFVQPLNPSVGLMIDGMDMSGLGSVASLFDAGQVEVLRGPQGTRYGANALAGLINIRSRAPGDSLSTRVSAGLASHSGRHLGVSLSGPFSHMSRGRLAVSQNLSDGYTRNTFLARRDTEARDELAVHGRLDLDLGESQLKLKGFHLHMDNGYDAFSFENSRRTRSDNPGFDRQKSLALAGELQTRLGGNRLQLLASAARHDQDYGFDEDWTFAGFHQDGYSSTDAYLRDRETWSLEARLFARDQTDLPWVAGLYHYGSREELKREYTFLSEPFESDYDFLTTALYADFRHEFSGQSSLEAGLRLEHRTSSYSNSDAVRAKPDHLMWGGRLAFVWQLQESGRIWLSLAQGFKAGGFNQDGSLPQELRAFDSEYLRELEVGSRLSFADGRVHLALAAFYDWRIDQQVKSSRVTQRPDGSTEFVDFLGNAASGRNYGMEAEASANLGNLQLSLSAGLLRTRFVDFVNEFGEDLSGRNQAHAPEYQLAFNLHWQFARNWHLGAGLTAKDSFYLSDRHAEQTRSWVQSRLLLGWQSGPLNISLWGRNLSDEDVIVRGFGSFGNDPRNGYATQAYYQYGEPRTYGLTFRFEG